MCMRRKPPTLEPRTKWGAYEITVQSEYKGEMSVVAVEVIE
jgi:hypothetical protein